MRLDKYLSLARTGTRKKTRELIYEGRVSVNGVTAQEPALQVEETDRICLDGHEIQEISRVCYLFYKPQGCVTAKSDETHCTVFDYFSGVDITGLFAVGRLDRDTEGMLLITNDGDLNHRLMNPDHHVEKTYFFWVFGRIDENGIQAVRAGIEIGGGERAAPGKLHVTECGSYSRLRERMRQDGCQAVKKNLHREDVTAGYLTISEGKKHQVKRMMRSIGCRVIFLKRVSIGGLKLDEALHKGEYRRLDQKEVDQL